MEKINWQNSHGDAPGYLNKPKVTPKEVKHTPTPWHIDDHNMSAILHQTGDRSYRHVALCDNKYDTGRDDMKQVDIDMSNAAFIVEAVNQHDSLIRQRDMWVHSYSKLKKDNEALLDALTMALPYVETALEDKGYKAGVIDKMVKNIRDAIVQAEVEDK